MIRRLTHLPVSTTTSACALVLDGGYIGSDDATPLISTQRGGHARGRAILGCDGQLHALVRVTRRRLQSRDGNASAEVTLEHFDRAHREEGACTLVVHR